MTLEIVETRDIALCRQLRRVVFIEEQGVSEADEVDDLDEVALHPLALQDGVVTGSAHRCWCGARSARLAEFVFCNRRGGREWGCADHRRSAAARSAGCDKGQTRRAGSCDPVL